MITLLGLGPGSFDLLSGRAARLLQMADAVAIRSADRPTGADWPSGIRWLPLEEPTEQAFAERLVAEARRRGALLFACREEAGPDAAIVQLLLDLVADTGVELRIAPGPARTDIGGAILTGGTQGGQLLRAADLAEPNPLLPLLVRGGGGPEALDYASALLARHYPPMHPVTVVDSRKGWGYLRRVTMTDLGSELANPDASLYLPPLIAEEAVASPFGLRAVVHRLRAPGGCPWDREQTPSSLVRFVLEEAYEVADAIERGSPPAVQEELGDLLLQVYLQAEIAEEAGDFDVSDVIRGLTEKLIRRHPHVFGSVQVANAADVERNWEQLKQAEKGSAPSTLGSVPLSLPALARAREVQRKVSKAGFDWPRPDGALAKLDEELSELRAVLDDPAELAKELGDVLFMLVKVAGDRGIDAEASLRGTIERVVNRFEYLERAAAAGGTGVGDLGIDRLLELWEEAKRVERSQE